MKKLTLNLGLIAIPVLVTAGGIALYTNINTLIKDSATVTHTREVLAELGYVQSALQDAETGQRGFVITGKEDYLEPYNRATKDLAPHLATVLTLTSDNPNQQARLQKLSPIIDSKLSELQTTIDLRRDEGFEAANAVIQTDSGKILMDQIRVLLREAVDEEDRLLKLRMSNVQQSVGATSFLGLVVLLLSSVVSAVIITLLSREIQKREVTEKELRDIRDVLAVRVEQRTAALEQVNQDLRAASEVRTVAEKVAQAEKDRYQFLADFVPQLIWTTDSTGLADYMNNGWLTYTGLAYERLMGWGWLDTLHPDDKEHARRLWTEAFSNGTIYEAEYRLLRHDGTYRWFLARGVPKRDADGTITQWFGSTTDVEDQKRINQTLQGLNQELTTFTFILSHDLRSPLANLKGFSSELKEALKTLDTLVAPIQSQLAPADSKMLVEVLKEDIPEAIKFILASTDRMDRLTNAVLQLSRLGRRELTQARISTQDVVESIINALSFQIRARNATVTVEALPDVIGDRVALEQIFGNLITNAVQYLNPDRAGLLEISSESDANGTTFHVRDNGRGIATVDFGKVFEPFRRVGLQDTQGEGMGLAYVQTLVKRLGGRIWFESELGQGTTFSFVLPRHPAGEGASVA